MEEQIIILDFGSQYTQVIARRIRECNVFSQILRYNTKASKLRAMQPKGLILSGGPCSVYAKDAPLPDPAIFQLGIPILGICYGLQTMGHQLGGKVAHSKKREYGHGHLGISTHSPLFQGLPRSLKVWNSHGDKLIKPPPGFRTIGRTESSEYAAIEDRKRRIYGLQFHPEVVHTPKGQAILRNFVRGVCGCRGEWTMGHYITKAVQQIRQQVGKDRVVLGLSGGVDSSVAAALIHKAIGNQLVCIFVNNGVLRLTEAERVQEVFRDNFHIKLKYVDAANLFLNKLANITDPERKRKIIGHTFIEVFDKAAHQVGRVKFLGQGTLYPDVIESVSIGGNPAAMIKSHHNVGGLPKKMKLDLLEPLRNLFKDEVRRVGEELGLPKEIVWRQPFPGPGLAVRILGTVNRERLRIVREADWIVVDEMKKSGWYYRVWQSFAVLLPIRTVGVMGDERTYDNVVAIRAVNSQDGMTADWVRLPYDLMQRMSTRIINEVRGVNRVCFDISSKPPSTIEWE